MVGDMGSTPRLWSLCGDLSFSPFLEAFYSQTGDDLPDMYTVKDEEEVDNPNSQSNEV